MSHSSSYSYYQGRYQKNERSRAWAANDGQPWSGDEDQFMLDFWVNVNPEERDERGVSLVLERTIEACRNRAEHLRRCGAPRPPLVSHRTITVTTITYDANDVCPRCFTVRAASGSCVCDL